MEPVAVFPGPASDAPANTKVIEIPLRGSAGNPDMEFSGLAWFGDHLLLLPQYPNRQGDHILALDKTDVLDYIEGRRNKALKPARIDLKAKGLDKIRGYEGVEAIVVDGDRAFVTVEAGLNGQMMGYLIPGAIDGNRSGKLKSIKLAVDERIELPPRAGIPNFSDEALVVAAGDIFSIYEANGSAVVRSPTAWRVDLATSGREPASFPPVEYRITDATEVDANGRFWVVNILAPDQIGLLGSGSDAVPVERLVELQITDAGIVRTDTPVITLNLENQPGERNWEGVARLDNLGFLVITDSSPRTILGFVPFATADASLPR